MTQLLAIVTRVSQRHMGGEKAFANCHASGMREDDFEAASARLFEYTFRAEDTGGYAGTYVHEDEQRVDLYWKGPLPASLTDLLDDIRAACPTTVIPAAHDVAELRRARDRIWALPADDYGIVMIGLEPDGSGLVLTHTGRVPPRQVVDQLELGVAVEWEHGSGPQSPLLHLPET